MNISIQNPEATGLNDAFDANSLVEFVESFIQSDDWSKSYYLPVEEREWLVDFLTEEQKIRQYTLNNISHFKLLALSAVRYAKRLPTYKIMQDSYHRERTAIHLQQQGVALSEVPKITDKLNPIHLRPADCGALQDWPARRQPVSKSGKLENAGQFMKRLIQQKLYNRELYGELYLHDLRSINPKLYLALSQWQNRTGEVVLGKKQDELKDLELQYHANPNQLSFAARSSVSSKRWRQKQKLI